MNVFEIQRRSVKSGKWVPWCHDNDREVMDTRFEYMSHWIERGGSDSDAVRLVSNKEVLAIWPAEDKKEI